jgi:4-amino-4-deoxy-L-arabinose transferase-like glycosyltransferase
VSRLHRWRESPWAGLLLVVVVAALLRYPALDWLPPGLNFDEGGEGVAALDVSHGVYRLWWPIGGGKEPLMAYLVQPLFWLFGPTRLALRLYTATLGLIAVAGTYWLAWEFAQITNRKSQISNQQSAVSGQPSLSPTSYSLLPLLAGLGLATAFWHVAYSRIAFRALAMPAVEALALAWLWRALRTSEGGSSERWYHFAGAGLFIGLGPYTYMAARFVPVALALFFVAEALLARLRRERPLLIRHWRGLALSAAAALLVFSPLAVFFALHPEAFVERAGSISIFNPTWNQGDVGGALLRTTLTTLGTFAGLTGDPNPIANLPGRPMLDWLLIPFFWLGVAVSVWGVVRCAANRPSVSAHAYLFLLCLWPVMLLPGILAPEGAPHHLRMIGTAPVTYLFVALGLEQIANIKRQTSNLKSQISPAPAAQPGRANLKAQTADGRPQTADRESPTSNLQPPTSNLRSLASNLQPLISALPLLLLLVVGLVTARDYFVRWAGLPELAMAYDVYAVELAGQMAADPDPAAAYVIPMDQRAGHEARHYSLDFLYRGSTPYYYLPVDEPQVAAQLTQAAAGHTTLRVVRWLQDKHVAADEREVVTFLLATTARLVGEKTYPVYRVETWALPSAQTAFALPAIQTPVGVTLGGVLRLEAVDVSVSGATVAVAVRWAPLEAMDVDYKASLRLVAADGKIAVQKDRVLLHNWHQGTHLWPPETVNEYYLLAPAPPGEYQVQVVVYHPETLAPLPAGDRAEVVLGTVQVK